ncbi:3-isopropylmalate dehydratase large subunit 2 [Striga asiatica]|uniref:3-isopropylmalate dehydratase large subunit 2 n=1 Tax=Striga asiatica TaxID=4170 RepID=A0A5A7QLY5_STRAF|nr:3-isopropylmalate dehydratase large subunit 2 [Striga asiatica]
MLRSPKSDTKLWLPHLFSSQSRLSPPKFDTKLQLPHLRSSTPRLTSEASTQSLKLDLSGMPQNVCLCQQHCRGRWWRDLWGLPAEDGSSASHALVGSLGMHSPTPIAIGSPSMQSPTHDGSPIMNSPTVDGDELYRDYSRRVR